jgi:hypothetical protein
MNHPSDFNLSQWLVSIELGHLVPIFEQNQITYEILQELTNEDLKECGVEALGQRKKLLLEIRNLLSNDPVPVSEPESPGNALTVSDKPADSASSSLIAAGVQPETGPPSASTSRLKASAPLTASHTRLRIAATPGHPAALDEFIGLAHRQDAYLRQRQRRSVFVSVIIAFLSLILVMLLLALFVLPALLVETPAFVTYETSTTDSEELDVKKVRTNIEIKPSSPTVSIAKVIAADTSSPVAVPVPDFAVSTPSVNFGDSEDFGGDWGESGFDAGSGRGISFFGLKKQPKSIVLVFDISGSMVVPPKSPKTYEALEEEIVNTISSLTSDVPFGLVAFSRDADAYRSRLVNSTMTERSSAMKWLKGMDPSGGVAGGRRSYDTNFRGGRHSGTRADLALVKAMKLDPDTIIFVSDGEPTDQKGKSSKGLNAAILRQVAAMQKGRQQRVQINVVAYMAGGGKDFMRQLASQNGGEFREIRNGATK